MRKFTLRGLFSSQDKAKGTTVEVDFGALFATHLDHVFNFCLMQLNDRALAEDITAEVFERAWEKRHTFNKDKGDFKRWIFQIARNRLIDEYRSRGRRTTISLNEDLADLADPLQTSPEAQLDRSELETRIIELMEQLTDDEKTIIALKFGAGLGNKDIAQIMKKTDGAVASNLYRALEKLRSIWKKGEGFDE